MSLFRLQVLARSYDETITFHFDPDDYEIRDGAIVCTMPEIFNSTHTKMEGWMVVEKFCTINKRAGVTITGCEYFADETLFMENVTLDSTWLVPTQSNDNLTKKESEDSQNFQKTIVNFNIINSGQAIEICMEPFTYNNREHTLWFAHSIDVTLHIEEEDEKELLSFLTEGKIWTCSNSDGRYSYDIEGDTLWCFSLHKKLFRTDHSGNRTFWGGLYESGTDVWIRLADSYSYQRLYRFGMNEEWDHFMYRYEFPNGFDPDFNASLVSAMDDARKVTVEGVERRYVELRTYAWIDRSEKQTFHWIEGIGSLYDPFDPRTCQEQTSKLLSCYDGETCLYDSQHPVNFAGEDGIKELLHSNESSSKVVNSKSVNRQFFDLSGHRLAAPPARGLYIEDGKVRVK